MTAILGISAFYHDSAAALVVDGRIVAAAQEERFTREKHDQSFPSNAINYCLAETGLRPEQLDFVGFYDKPLLKFDRLLETYLAFAPAGFESFLKAMPVWLRQKLHLPREMRNALGGAYKKRFVFTEHHESHAASAFFPCPWEEAAILTMDGVGEWATASIGVGRGNRIELKREVRFPHSLGLLYSAFTYYGGFTVNEGEYKLMGLAPYGEPRYVDLILEHLVDLKEDGSMRLDLSYFNYCQGLTMTGKKFDVLFGGPPRRPDAPLTQRDMDIAASIQKVTEEAMLRMARHAHKITGLSKLCLAGGVALNCVGNGRILREGPFDDIWIQPAAGDAGGALGVALFIWHQLLSKPRTTGTDAQYGSQLGREFSNDEVEIFLRTVGAAYRRVDDETRLVEDVARSIADGKVVGWFQGRMEFGPRALGFRSILGDARNPAMQSIINMKVKFREGFRPFAPIVLAEHAHEYFDVRAGQESPYMLIVAPVRNNKRLDADTTASGIAKLKIQRSVIPAVTHVDFSARIQTVDAERHGRLRRMMESFFTRTGCPVLVNTSFNLGWEPIVNTPADAYRTFMASQIDLLCIGNFILEKHAQPAEVTTPDGALRELVGAGHIVSPCCRQPVQRQAAALICPACQHEFQVTDNIPQLFWPHEAFEDPGDVTEIVKAFYEETPFPNYDDHDSVRSLMDKSRRGIYARRLDESIPYNASVLEVGCGTGQLTNFLGISCRRVVGTDMCLNSLRLGEAFRAEHGLARVQFAQMNLFRPVFRDELFDVVLCNGVLHHTADPYGGFKSILKLVRPGGHIVIGLYNTYGRLFTDARRQLFRLTGGGAKWIDPVLRQTGLSSEKRRAWFADQYQHPHESKHTMGEVLGWFSENGVEFVRGIPALRPDDDGLAGSSLFEPQSPGIALERFVVQASEIVAAGQREGGFFIMIGRVPGGAAADRPATAGVREYVAPVSGRSTAVVD
ncbi:MAG: methyltransferase domain-containing protein [Gammaproteobacteria bacterium]|nr:methyltransferase domain-containing protein [Gammaproteobacteria bacterium]